MTSTLYSVDGVIDGSGLIGNEVLVSGGEIVQTGYGLEEPGASHERRAGYVVPGFRDAHLHLASISTAATGVSVNDAQTFLEMATRLNALGTGDLIGIGLDETSMNERRLPTRDDLDALFQDRAVLIYRVCGHVAIANTMALERAGVESGAVDPEGGVFDRTADGRVTGVLRETAIDLVVPAIDSSLRAVPGEQLLATAHRLVGMGLTTADAMIPAGAPAWCGPDDELARLLELDGRLPLPINAILIADTTADLRQHAEVIVGAKRIRFAGWKGFSDGSLGGHTAALSRPYDDRTVTSGTDRSDTTHFRLMAETSLELGGSVCIHAIGDAAVDDVLDLFADLIRAGAAPSDLRVEHASVLSPELIARFAELDVVASVQPSFVTSDARWLDERLGPDRARWAYPFRSMLDAGVTLVGGSDAPVERPDPLAGARSAVGRAGWNTVESLTEIEALGSVRRRRDRRQRLARRARSHRLRAAGSGPQTGCNVGFVIGVSTRVLL